MEDLKSYYLSASAGSGKTVALSVRFCHLVAAGVPPDAICALTFTRAATREIFSAVVKRLVKNDVKDLGLTAAQRAQVLARVLEALPRLQISTIDAFSAKVARLFAYELGFNPDFTLYEEGSGAEAREALRETVRRALRVTSETSAEALLRRLDVRYEGTAPAGALCERLQTLIRDFGRFAEGHPRGWGNLDALGVPLPRPCANRLEAMAVLRAQPLDGVSEKHAAAFRALLEEYRPEIESLRELKARWGGAWEKAEKFHALSEEGCHTYYRKTLTLTSEARAAAGALWQDLLARDLGQSARHTAALHEAISALEEASAAWSAETGRMGFSELTRALACALGGRLSVCDPERMYVAYRLDAAIRHLMIDEFQDTSTEQWSVLSGIAHELAAAEDGTFFYVGDTKQSIYGWRGGDATLFGDPGRVPDIPAGTELVKSYRSSPDIIAMVNRVFRLPAGIEAEAEPWQREPLRAWRACWRDHVAHREDLGRAEAIVLGGKKADWMGSLAAVIAARWKTLSSRRLSGAVLAPTNGLFQGNGGDEPGLLARLRTLGVDCAIDGRRRVSDAPMGRLVKALLHWMADPRATLWGEIARQLGLAERSDSATLAGWMEVVAREGFVAWADALFGPETPCGGRLTEYDREVLATVRQGLQGVDDAGSVDPADAWAAVEGLEVPCSADARVLSLMTIHHSKGLTFDVVFTVLAGDLLNERGETCEVGEDWVLERPVLGETYEAVPPLEMSRNTRREQRYRDDLCALYVALTRARREQIVLAPEKEAESLRKRAGLVFRALSGEACPVPEVEGATRVFASGNPDWWEGDDVPLRTDAVPVASSVPWKRSKGRPKPEVELPSERARAMSLAELLAEDADAARQFGLSEHSRFAAVAWSETEDLGLPETLASVFRKPKEPCELWRERPFSVRVSERGALRYLAGQFDRVHLFPAERKAVIYDFKTARRAEVTPGYVRQMSDYRTALAALTGWPKENLRAVLLFTRAGKAVEVPCD